MLGFVAGRASKRHKVFFGPWCEVLCTVEYIAGTTVLRALYDCCTRDGKADGLRASEGGREAASEGGGNGEPERARERERERERETTRDRERARESENSHTFALVLCWMIAACQFASNDTVVEFEVRIRHARKTRRFI